MELKGVRFGRLAVLHKAVGTKRMSWVCVCDCGNKVVKAQVDLRSGDTTSCGCLKREMLALRNTTHGLTDTPAYRKWKGMWARVRDTQRQQNACYKNIKVCKRWESFQLFLEDMGAPPKGFSLDRINNNKGYSKSNCRWVPLSEQAKNTRRLRMYKGQHISEAARAVGLDPDVVFDRINKLGWDIETALKTPKRK